MGSDENTYSVSVHIYRGPDITHTLQVSVTGEGAESLAHTTVNDFLFTLEHQDV